jgi:uncharacterized cupin superfamily protein
MTRLVPGTVTDAPARAAAWESVPADQVVSGDPRTRYVELHDAPGRAIGVWEMSPGAMRDVEADEVFVVLSGEATVEFEDPALPAIDLRPGSIVRLTAGMRTVWTVRETLRKVYITP